MNQEHYWKDVRGASFLLCVCNLYVDLGLGYLLGENFVPLSRNLGLIDYQNAQIILIGAREGRDVIKNEVGIEIEEEENESQQQQTSDIFTKLKVQRDKVPIKPLIEGKLE